jgi:hypothetical protein
MIQHSKFENTGGFVLHKVPVDGRGKFSAWFDAAGRLLDCERSGGGHVPQTFTIIRAELQRIGGRYVGK